MWDTWLAPFDGAQRIVEPFANWTLPVKHMQPPRHTSSPHLLHDTPPLSTPQGFEKPTAQEATLSR